MSIMLQRGVLLVKRRRARFVGRTFSNTFFQTLWVSCKSFLIPRKDDNPESLPFLCNSQGICFNRECPGRVSAAKVVGLNPERDLLVGRAACRGPVDVK